VPTLYFAQDGQGIPAGKRATLTFGELRGMFGAYEPRYLSPHWPELSPDSGSRFSRVLVHVTERERASGRYEKPGFYLVVGLSAAKVDELLKHRDSYARRFDDAELWGARYARLPGQGPAG